MLYLYGKNATDFTTNGEPIRNSYDEHVIRDEGFYLSFKLLLDKEEQYKIIKKEMIISALTPEGRNQFRVYDTWKRDTYVEIMAVQLMYDFDNKQVNSFKLKKANGKQVIQSFQNSFKSPLSTFTLDSSVTEQHDFSTNDEDDNTLNHNALEILNRITKRWDSELMLNGFDIRMIKRLGEKTDALLYEKKNISEFEDESTMRGMATRIHATSTFRAEGSEEDTTISVTVDSPLLDEYAQVYEKSYVNNDCHTEAELIDWVKLKYSTQNIDKPKRTIRVSTNIIDGTEINYGDDLVLKYLVHDVDEIIRCVGYDYDPIRATYYSVTLGDWKDSFLNAITGSIIDTTDKELEQIKNNMAYVRMAANGKNRNAWGPYPVPNPINGDQWFYFEWERPNEIELRIYQDGEWIPIRFASKQEVEQAQATAAQARQDAIKAHDEAIAEADRLVKEQSTKFEADLTAQKTQIETDITTSRDEAVATAQAGISALETAQNTRMDGIKAEADEIKATADGTRAEVDLAVANAGFTNLNDTVFALGTLAASARDEAIKKVDRSEYLTKMQSVTTDLGKKAETALVNQQLAGKVAQVTYDKKVGELGTAISGNATAIQRTETELTSKASQTEVDAVKGRLATAETGITQNASQVAIKANQTDLDTTKGRLTTAEASIIAQAKEIDLKVAQTDFNALSGEVSTAKTNINLNKDALLLKAEKSELNAVSQKVSANEASIKVANDRIDLSATKVEVGKAMEEVVADDKTEILSGVGEVFTDKADDDSVVHVEIDGKSYQDLSKGKNIFDFKTFELYGNKSSLSIRIDLELKPNTSYTLSSNIPRGDSAGSDTRVLYFNGTTYTSDGIYEGNYQTKTTGTDGKLYILNHPTRGGDKLMDGTYWIQLEEGPQATGYAAYQTPAPDHPIEIHGLNDFDVVSSTGRRNLVASSGEIIKPLGDLRLKLIDRLDELSAGTYTIQFDYEIIAGDMTHPASFLLYTDASGEGSGVIGQMYGTTSSANSGRVVQAFEISSTRANQGIAIYAGEVAGQSRDRGISFRNVKIEKNATDTPYTPAPEDIQPDTFSPTLYKTNILLSEPLRSVGDVKDRIYRDSDGLWKVERNVGELILSGLKGWSLRNSLGDTKCFYTLLPNSIGDISASNRFVYQTRSWGWVNTLSAIGYTILDGKIFLKLPSAYAMTNEMLYEWLKNNETMVQYALDVPTVETLPQDLQTKLNNIASFKGDNYVYTVFDKSDILSPELHAVFKSKAWYNNFNALQNIKMVSASLEIEAERITQTIVNVEGNRSSINQVEATATSNKASITDHSGRISTTEQTVGALQTTVASKADQSQITQLETAINLKVAKGGVSSEINIEAGRTLISTGKLVLDANTYILGTTFADDIKAKSLEAVDADIANIRTKVLTADVITSTHLKVDAAMITKLKVGNLLATSLSADSIMTNAMKSNTLTAIGANIATIRSKILVTDSVTSTHVKADNAMIDALFATTALIDRLTTKEAFITNIKAIDISADRITAGTLNAANVNIINLNVSRLVGNTSNFVQSAWNETNGSISINSTALTIQSNQGWDLKLQRNGAVISDKDGVDAGRFSAFRGSEEGTLRSIGIAAEKGFDVIMGYQGEAVADYYNRALSVNGTTGLISVYRDIRLESEISIFPSSNNTNNFKLGWTTLGGVVLNNGNSAANITLFNNGDVGIYGGKTYISDIYGSRGAHTGVSISHGAVSISNGVWVQDTTKSAGFFLGKDGEVYMRIRGVVISMKVIANKNGYSIS